jgi:hypothetical protein
MRDERKFCINYFSLVPRQADQSIRPEVVGFEYPSIITAAWPEMVDAEHVLFQAALPGQPHGHIYRMRGCLIMLASSFRIIGAGLALRPLRYMADRS